MTAIPKPKKHNRQSLRVDKSGLALAIEKPARDSSYRAWVRTHRCALRGFADHHCWGDIEAAHIGKEGLGVKASDFTCVPFCHRAHEVQTQLGWARFVETYNFNAYKVAFYLLQEWHLRTKRGDDMSTAIDVTS